MGRFLSVDPIVRDAGASQSWNGYGYVEGRTLSWTDPSAYEAQLEGITVTGQRDKCGAAGILCNVSVGIELRQLFANLPRGLIGGSTGLNGPAAAPAEEPADEGSSEDVEAPQTPPPPCGARGTAEPDSALAVVSALATVGTAAQDAGQLSDRVSAFNNGSRVLGTMTQGRLALGTLAHSIDWLKFNRGITYISLPVAANQFVNGWQAGGAERIYATGDVMFGVSAVVLLGPAPGAMVSAAYSMAGGTKGLARQTMKLAGMCIQD